MWRISSMVILNCTRMVWKNEQQAGETTGNLKSTRGSWICDTGFNNSF
jgi:hypothetical protein